LKVLPHVIRNINEFNIPAGDLYGYAILYFGVNLILMFDYRLSFDIEVKNSDEPIQVLIISRKSVPAWKEKNFTDKQSSGFEVYYNNRGIKFNDVFRPSVSDAYAFILNNRLSDFKEIKTLEVTLNHNWQQEVTESQLKDRE